MEKTLGKLGTSEEIILYIIVLTTIEYPTKGSEVKGIVRVSEDVDYNLPIIKKNSDQISWKHRESNGKSHLRQY